MRCHQKKLLLCALVLLASALSVGRADSTIDPTGDVQHLVNEVDAGRDVGLIVNTVGERGVGAAVDAARFFDEKKSARNAALCELIAQAAQNRRAHPELLRIYDPAAFRLFHTTQGLDDQRLIARALDFPDWPTRLPEAMVRAAPLPTLDWLRAQAASKTPRAAPLLRILQTWGFWRRVGHERQHADTLAQVAAQLLSSPALRADDETHAALCRFAGEVRSLDASDALIQALRQGGPATRAQAATACGLLATDATRDALIDAAKSENDPLSQQKIASALERWHRDERVGDALYAIFERASSPSPRREVMFVCANARWPRRAALLLRAFEPGHQGHGILGAALVSLAARPEPDALAPLLLLAQQTETDAQPPLIDALAATRDARAAPHLLRWLRGETNPVVRVKLLLALEKVTTHEADAILLELIQHDAAPMVVEQSLGIVGRKKTPGCEPTIIALALDPTAPIQVRIEAIWAMGGFDSKPVRDTLAKIETQAKTLFSPPGTPGPPGSPGNEAAPSEAADLALLMTALAQIKLQIPDADARLQTAFDRGTATAKLTALIMLGHTGRDHPIIAQSLRATDLAILLGAVKATAANPKKYHAQLVALAQSPWLKMLFRSGLDSVDLEDLLEHAIQAGEKP